MTTIDQAREAIYQKWRTDWGSTTPFIFENEDNKTLDKGTVPWARFSVRNLAGRQHTLGAAPNRIFRRQAAVFVQIFTPANGGMQKGGELAQAALDIFEGARVGGCDFIGGQPRELGPDGKWYSILVEIQFTYDNHK